MSQHIDKEELKGLSDRLKEIQGILYDEAMAWDADYEESDYTDSAYWVMKSEYEKACEMIGIVVRHLNITQVVEHDIINKDA